MVNAALSRENWLSEHELGDDAANGPHINGRCVVGVSEDKLGSPVVSGANVRHIWLTLHQLFGATEVAELKHMRLRIAQYVLWFDISVADAFGVNVSNRSH